MSRSLFALIPKNPLFPLVAIAVLLSGTALAAEDKSTPEDAVLRPPPLSRVGTPGDSTIAALVGQVDADTLYAFLQKLTGEVDVDFAWGSEPILTRYSNSRGQDIASHFLAEVFEGYGWDVEYHYFLFSANIESIVLDGGAGLAVGAKGRILETADGAEWKRTWTGVESFTLAFREVSRISASDWVVVGNNGTIATSDDGAASWTMRTSGTTERLDGVDVRSSGIGWIAGRNGTLLNTTDSGVTWIAQASGVASFLYDIDAIDDLTAVAVGAGGTILRTTDGGANWSAVTSGTTSDLFRADFAGGTGWAVGANGTILTTADSGASWSAQTSGVATALKGVSFVDASNGWVAGSAATILRTTDGGANWIVGTGPIAGLNQLGVQAVSASEAWVVGFGGAVLYTTDSGASWENRNGSVQDGWVNMVATLPGTSNANSEVILGGHYDSYSESPNTLAPGADDNGSGCAVVVEAARLLPQAYYERTIKLVLFSGEEEGLRGAAAYAQRATANGEQIHAIINLDSEAWNNDYHRIFSNDDSGWLGDIALNNALTYAPTLTTFHWYCPGCNWSDHWEFWQQGYSAIVGIETWDPAPPQHHTTGDTLSLLDVPLLVNVAKIYVSTTAELAVVNPGGPTSVDDFADASREGVRLHAGIPNPMSTHTMFRFNVPVRTEVVLGVYDVGGRLVRVLERGLREPGRHAVTWDGNDRDGRPVAAGVYFTRLEAAGQVRTRTVTVLR